MFFYLYSEVFPADLSNSCFSLLFSVAPALHFYGFTGGMDKTQKETKIRKQTIVPFLIIPMIKNE